VRTVAAIPAKYSLKRAWKGQSCYDSGPLSQSGDKDALARATGTGNGILGPVTVTPGEKIRAKNMKQTTKPQPVNKEAFKMLAMEIGLNAASRKLNVPIPTGKSWARRGKWELPKQQRGRPAKELAASTASFLHPLHPIAGALMDTFKEREEQTRGYLSQTVLKGSQEAAELEKVLPEAARLQALGAFVARTFGWSTDQRPSVNYYGDVNTLVVYDEAKRKQLIEQRQRLLEDESQAKVIADTVRQHQELTGHKAKAAVPVTLPAPETEPNANEGTGNSTDPPPVAQDPLTQWRDSVGRAETWKTNEPEHHAGQFGPHPEEIY